MDDPHRSGQDELMFRLALRSVIARWGRLLLTSLAIVASTAFLSGTLRRVYVRMIFRRLFRRNSIVR